MRSRFYSVLPAAAFLLSLCLPVSAQTAPPPAAPPISQEAVTFTPDQMREDLRVLRTALQEGHPGLYRYTPKTRIDSLFAKTEQKLDHPMNALELFRLLSPVCAAIKCGHTFLLPPETYQKQMQSAALFPFDVEIIAGKAYILRDFSTQAPGLEGAEIRAINGIPTPSLLEKMMEAMPGDGDIQTGRAWRIGRDGGIQKLLPALLGLQSPFQITCLRRGEKAEERFSVEGVTPIQRETALKARYAAEVRQWETQPNASLAFPETGVAVLTIRVFGGFADRLHKQPMDTFLAEAFQEIQAKGTQSLILDLRDNGGGRDELGKQLLAYLVDKPFRYYDDLILNSRAFSFAPYADPADPIPAEAVEKGEDGKWHCTKHPNWGVQQPALPTFHGRVIALMNGGSFSTTCEFLSNLHYHHRAVFVGEEPGGAYYGNTSGFGTQVTLPHSRLVLRLPLMTYYLAVRDFKPASRGVPPDRPVTTTIEDLLTHQDRGMQTAMRLAQESAR